jgi:hypothetical protein
VRRFSPEHHEGNSGFMGQRLQRNHNSWTKCRQLPVVVWRRVEKDFTTASEIQKATAVDFDQLLEMTAVSFKMRIRFSTSNPQDMHESVLQSQSILIFANTFIYLFNQGAIES